MQLLGDMKILVVEDRPEDLDFTRECLQQLGVGEPVHANCMEGMKSAVANTVFDAVLLDLVLPETQGIDTVRMARSIISNAQNNNEVPIIVLTGLDDFSISKEALKCGAKDYLVKGEYGPHELQRALTFATFGRCNPKRSKKTPFKKLWTS